MTLYEFITKNKSVINTLFKGGVLAYSVINNYAIFQYYLDALENGNSKSMTIEMTMMHFEISNKSVYNVINQFNAEI